MKEYEKSTGQALRLIYFLIISFAITKSLQVHFTKNDMFIWPDFDNLCLFIVFQSFVTRFFLGAYRIFSEDIENAIRRQKIILDIIIFYIQALLFYIYSVNSNNLILSQWIIIFLCAIDTIWLIILLILEIDEDTSISWLIHNMIMIDFCAVSIMNFWGPTILLIVSVIAFMQDFIINNKFYFPIHNTDKKIVM